MRTKQLNLALVLATVSIAGHAEVYVSPWIGFTLGGNVEDQNQNELDLQGSEGLALSIETDFDTGRIGLFYANQNTQVETINSKASIHYLHFQSSIYYPVEDKLSTYLGIGIGGSYIDADWVSNEVGFSASIFGGFEYELTPSIAINSQLRWLGTVVDNDTSGVCNLPTNGNSSCVLKFKTDWMNQFSANLGLTIQF